MTVSFWLKKVQHFFQHNWDVPCLHLCSKSMQTPLCIMRQKKYLYIHANPARQLCYALKNILKGIFNPLFFELRLIFLPDRSIPYLEVIAHTRNCYFTV